MPAWPLLGSSRHMPSWFWKVIPFTKVVSLASPLAVMVVGKKTVAVPLPLFGEMAPSPVAPPPGDMMVKGDTGMLPNPSMKLEPLPKGELARFAEVGSPWAVRGKAPPTMV